MTTKCEVNPKQPALLCWRMDLPDAENVARAAHALFKRRVEISTSATQLAALELANEIYDGELDRCKDIDCDLAST
jgi:hypothetical protein